MAIDIKKEAQKLIKLIQDNPELVKEFTKDPIKFVEKKTGLDLPDEQIKKIVEEIKKKVVSKVDAKTIAKGVELLSKLKK